MTLRGPSKIFGWPSQSVLGSASLLRLGRRARVGILKGVGWASLPGRRSKSINYSQKALKHFTGVKKGGLDLRLLLSWFEVVEELTVIVISYEPD